MFICLASQEKKPWNENGSAFSIWM